MDLKAEMQNFKAINLEEIVRDDTHIPDKIRNSIFLYNKAIESLRSGSEDIAAIELKKAISMNPQFYEAMNLLGVCYGYSGDKEKAAEVFNKVMEAESNSIMAMEYMQQFGLIESMQPRKNRQVKQPVQQPGEPLKRIRATKQTILSNIQVKTKTIIKASIIGAGFVAGFLLSAILFASLPQKEAKSLTPPQSKTEPSNSEIKAEYEAKYAELERKYGLLQQDKENAVQLADYYKATLKLNEIDILFRDKKYEDAADMLLLMKTIEFKDAEKDKFNELYNSVMPLAAKVVYDQGYKLYNSRKYQDSLKKLEMVQVYYPEFNRIDAVLYYMGRSCQMLQDSRSALALFQKLVEGYPKTTYARSAKARINEIIQIP